MQLRNLSKVILATLAIIAGSNLIAVTTQAQQRPDYPWTADVPFALGGNQARHHIIPWQELISFGVGEYVTVPDVTNFLTNYNLIGQANLGSFANINTLAAAYINEHNDDHAEAREIMFSLFAWMQGNLVIGPNNANRPHGDPGDMFDQRAFDCHQHYSDPVLAGQYNNLEARWNGTPLQELGVFTLLSQNAMLNQATAQDQVAPPVPACQW